MPSAGSAHPKPACLRLELIRDAPGHLVSGRNGEIGHEAQHGPGQRARHLPRVRGTGDRRGVRDGRQEQGISRPVGSNTYSRSRPDTGHGRAAGDLQAQQPPAVHDELLRRVPACAAPSPPQVGMVEGLVERTAGEQRPARTAGRRTRRAGTGSMRRSAASRLLRQPACHGGRPTAGRGCAGCGPGAGTPPGHGRPSR